MIFNQAQIEAISTIDGPLMVIAGPGTGKTTILTQRILSILQSDLQPENILCLTFTDAAANVMRKRLIELIGSNAHRVEICTFHSFCQKVITEYKNELKIQSLEPVSTLEQVRFYNSIIDNLDENNSLHNYKTPYSVRNDLIFLNRFLKQENYDKEKIFELAEVYIEKMKSDDSMYYKKKTANNNVGDFNENKFEKCKNIYNKIKDATNICYHYRNILAEQGRYELDDMILWVINLFKANSDILLDYQERYQYIMVDEFQDNNKIQFELTLLLASYWDNPNLMIVGDDDQSIYRFQGANVENLKDFRNTFAGSLKEILLVENYRSSQIILNAAENLIAKNSSRLLQNKKLESKSLRLKSDTKIEIVECKNKFYEATFVVEEIEKLQKAGVKLNEIAIIYRRNKESIDFEKLLIKKNIPYYLKKKSNIFEEKLIKDIVTIMNYIYLESKEPNSGQHLLFGILHFDFWKIDSYDLAKLAYYIKNNNLLWRNALNSFNTNNELAELVSKESFDKLTLFISDIEYLITQSFNVPLINLAEKIITRGGILSNILNSDSKKFYLEILNTFFEFLKDEFRNNPKADYAYFINLLELIIKEKIDIETAEIFEKKEAVNLTTAHSSKGLEFEAVFVIGNNKEIWDDKTKDKYFGLKDILNISDENSINEEKRRLFYVACTRAKSYLYLSYCITDTTKAGKSLNESLFISEISESESVIRTKFDDKYDNAIESVIANLQIDESFHGFKTLESELLNQFTENYILSATHLDDYLECPVKFYYKYVLKIPTVPSIYIIFGNAVHKALELFFDKMLKSYTKQYPDIEQLIFGFKNEMSKNRHFLSQTEFDNFINYGINIVFPSLYNNFIDEWESNKKIITENNIRNVVVNNVPIKGKIDYMQILDNNLVKVIDFKTGKFNSNKSKYHAPPDSLNEKKRSKKENLYGGKYWRQIVFYYLLINNNKLNNYKVLEGEIIYVEQNQKKEFDRFKIFLSQEEILFVEILITEVYGKIKNHEFNVGCNEKDCEWCNFNKNYINNASNNYESLLIEEED